MRRAAVVVALLGSILAAVGTACGLDLQGTMDVAVEPSEGAPPNPSAPDGHAPDSGAEAAPLPEIPIGGEAPIDAGVDAPGDCGSPLIADNFNGSNTIGAPWITSGTTAHGTEVNANGYVKLIPTGQGNKLGGLFAVPTVQAKSFITAFRYFAQIPGGAFGDVGDGFAFVWFTSGTINATTLGDGVTGAGLGLPRALSGVAFAFDAYSNLSIGDPDIPSFSLLSLVPTRGTPGNYDWHIKNDGPYSGVYDGWRTVTVVLDKGKVSADVDGTKLFQAVSVPSANIVAIGFSAGTGGVDSLGFNVDTVRIELTDAVCP